MVLLPAGPVERWCDGLLDAAVALLAAWTVAYHVCLVLRLCTAWAIWLTLALLAASSRVLRRLRSAESQSRPVAGISVAPRVTTWAGWAPVAVGAAVVAAAGMATDGPWLLVWPFWLAA